jgi:hypothetical protein
MVQQILEALRGTLPSGEDVLETYRPIIPPELYNAIKFRAPESLLNPKTWLETRDQLESPWQRATYGTAAGVPEVALNLSGVAGREFGQPLLGLGAAAYTGVQRAAESLLPPQVTEARRMLADSTLAKTGLLGPLGDQVDRETPLPSLTRESLREFGRAAAHAKAGGVGEFAFESAADPMNYLPIGRLGKVAQETGLALKGQGGARALLGGLLEHAGQTGQGYQEATDMIGPLIKQGVGGGLRGAVSLGGRIPGVEPAVEHLFSPSARSNVNKLVQNVGRSLESVVAALPDRVTDAGEKIAGTYRQIVEPLGMALPEGQRMWPNLQQFWTAIEDSTMALDGWQRKTAALSLLKKVHLDKDLIDAAGAAERTAARKQTLLGEADPNYMYPDEFDAFKRVSYKRQGDSQRALQISTQEHLDALRDDITIPGADGSAHDEQISRLVDTTVEQMRQDVFRKRNLAQVAGEVLLPGNEDEFDELAGAMDTFYRQGRAAAINTAARGVDEIAGLLPGGLPEATGKLIDGTIHGYMSSTADLMKQVGPLEDRLSSMAVSEQGKRVLVDQEVALRAADRKTQALYYNVTRTATPILRQALADNLLPMLDEGAEASVSHYLRDSFTAVQAMQDIKAKRLASGLPGDQAGMQKVITTLQKTIGDGDILQDGDWLQLSMRNFRNAVAPGMGVSTPPPWLTWPAGVLNMWKGTALLSPRFQFANLAFGLFSGDREGVAAGEVVKHLGRNLSSLNQQILDMYAQQHGTTAAGMGNRQTVQAYLAAIMDRPDFKPTVAKDSARLQWGLGRRQGDAALFPGGDAGSSVDTNFRGVPISGLKAQGIWAGAMGVGGATGGAILPAEDDEQRREQIMRGAITGAAFGVATPSLLWANKLLNRASEEAMRKTAIHTGMKRHMVGAHEEMLAGIPAAQGTKVATDVRDVTRGGVPVESIEHVTGLPVAEVVPTGTSPGARGSTPWAVRMTADMSMGEAARIAAERAATEQARRQFATHGQVQTVLDAFRDELRATHGPDILSNQFQLPGEDAERLALLEEAVVRLKKAQSLTPRMQEVLADLAPLEDISQFPVDVSAPTGMMLQGDVPEGALWKLQTWLQSRVQTEGELAGIMLVAPREIAEHAVGLGIDERTAASLGGQWDAIIREGEAAGMGLSNQIHGDYGDVNVMTEWLRGTGVFPFMTFAVKQAPNMLTWLIQDPRLVIAIDRLNNLSEQEISEAGLPPKFERLASTGILGDAIAGFMMGRPDATLMANVAGLINPYAEIGRGVNQVAPAPDRRPAGLQQASDVLSGLGLGLGPVPSLAGRVTGLLEDFGGPQLRTSSYIEALSGAGGGPQVNPEQVPIEIIRALRGGITGERQDTLTGSSTKDYAVRQRIAEMAYEKTGKPPSQARGDWLEAMDDPSSPIWKQALRQVERQRAGQTLVSSTLPFRTKLLSDTERTVTEARTRAGTSAAQLAALPKGTAEEKAASAVELSRRFKAASTQNPTALVMSNLGGTDEQTGGRMYSAYLTKQKSWKGMSKQRHDAERKAYIQARPPLGRYLAAHGYF